jgi:hypothetical protein
VPELDPSALAVKVRKRNEKLGEGVPFLPE